MYEAIWQGYYDEIEHKPQEKGRTDWEFVPKEGCNSPNLYNKSYENQSATIHGAEDTEPHQRYPNPVRSATTPMALVTIHPRSNPIKSAKRKEEQLKLAISCTGGAASRWCMKGIKVVNERKLPSGDEKWRWHLDYD